MCEEQIRTYLNLHDEDVLTLVSFNNLSEFKACVRTDLNRNTSNVNSSEQCNSWIKQFSESTKSQWIVRNSWPNLKTMVYRKLFVCHHSNFKKIKDNDRVRSHTRIKGKGCDASVDIKIKKINRFTIRNDNNLKNGLSAVININFHHSHLIHVAEAYSYLNMTADTRRAYIDYFNDGMTPSIARSFHEMKLMTLYNKDVAVQLADSQLNPREREIMYLYDEWRISKGTPLPSCSKAFEGFEFKSISMDTEDGTFTYIKSENETSLDQPEFYMAEGNRFESFDFETTSRGIAQPEIYLEESKEHLRTLLEYERICEFCKGICTLGFTPLKDLESDVTCNFNISEMNFYSINEPVVCPTCLNSLTTQGSCLKMSLDIKNKITNSSGNKEGPAYIKTEEIEIKSEERKDGNTSGCNEEPRGDQTSQDCDLMQKSLPDEPQPTNDETSEMQKYQCETCDFKSRYKTSLVRHRLMHQEICKYKCATCGFETKHKQNLKLHQATHNDISVPRRYNCEACGYKTNNKINFECHLLKHRDPSELQTYKCDACSYETKCKRYLAQHRSRHITLPDTQMYNCDVCDYKTKYRNHFDYHVLKHKDVSEVQMYKCDKCTFETKRKGNLIRHGIIHKDISEVQVYKCNKCEYETIHKKSLTDHQLVHKNNPEAQKYGCDMCSFATKYKNSLAQHLLLHKDVSEVPMYECETCEFKTRLKTTMVRHQVLHKDSSQVQMYKCDTCNFETKHKHYLTRHRRRHKNVSELRMYKCDKCKFKSRLEPSLVRHQLMHRDV